MTPASRHRGWLGALVFAIAVLLPAHAADADDGSAAAAERAGLVEAVAAKLDAEYIDPELAKKMGRAIRAHARDGRYADIADGQALADALTRDLREVGRDKHLWLGYHPGGARDEPRDGPSQAELDQWRDAVARDNFSFDRVERREGNIGYLKFRIFAYPYLAADTAAAAMSFLAHTDALIVDLRQNIGGDPRMVAFLLSYLFDEVTRLNDIQSRNGERVRQAWTLPHVPGQVFGGKKPVFVLTSRETFSAAEDYAYALQALKRAKIVGETSGGGAHPSRAFKVSDHFVVSVPYARSLSPITGGNWEGVGVVPDVPAAANDALDVAYRAALNSLIESATDDARKREWQGLLSKQP